MASLNLNISKTALVSMDMHARLLENTAMAKQRNLVGAARSVLDAARKSGLTVIHVVLEPRPGFTSSRNKFFNRMAATRAPAPSAGGAPGGGATPAAAPPVMTIAEPLAPAGNEAVVGKPRVSAFYGSALQALLFGKDIDTLVLMGVQTPFVVEATARYAADEDYRVIVLEDCCAAASEDAHKASIAFLDNIADVCGSADFLGSVK